REHRGAAAQARGAALSHRKRARALGALAALSHEPLSLHRCRRPLGDARRIPARAPGRARENGRDRDCVARPGPARVRERGGAHHHRPGELRSASHLDKREDNMTETTLPEAGIRRRRRFARLAWIVPVVAVIIAGYVVAERWRQFGPQITIRFA